MRDKSRQTYLLDLREKLPLINHVWYIEGTKEKILIDASGSAECSRRGTAKTQVDAGKMRILFSYEPPAKVGLDPTMPDIRTVFNNNLASI